MEADNQPERGAGAHAGLLRSVPNEGVEISSAEMAANAHLPRDIVYGINFERDRNHSTNVIV